MEFVDVHAHYDDEEFENDLEEELKEIKLSGVTYIINAGSSIKSSKKAIELANTHENMYATCGIHPEVIEDLKNVEVIEQLAKLTKVVAIGEIGLDYHNTSDTKNEQMELFKKQLAIAKRLHMPVQIHSRDAVCDMLVLLKQKELWPEIVMFHCYELNNEITKIIIERGYYVSLGGNITYKRTEQAIEQIKQIPLKQIMLETDSPYLAPTGYRGQRNSSKYIYKVAETLAKIKEITIEEVALVTSATAKNIYCLK